MEGNFVHLGYESSYFISNMGTLIIINAMQFTYIAFLASLSACRRTRKWSRHKLRAVFFNKYLAYFQGTLLILILMALINIKQVYNERAPANASYYVAILTLTLYSVSSLMIAVLLC